MAFAPRFTVEFDPRTEQRTQCTESKPFKVEMRFDVQKWIMKTANDTPSSSSFDQKEAVCEEQRKPICSYDSCLESRLGSCDNFLQSRFCSPSDVGRITISLKPRKAPGSPRAVRLHKFMSEYVHRLALESLHKKTQSHECCSQRLSRPSNQSF